MTNLLVMAKNFSLALSLMKPAWKEWTELMPDPAFDRAVLGRLSADKPLESRVEDKQKIKMMMVRLINMSKKIDENEEEVQ